MDIESELPEDFDQLPPDEKIEHLEELKAELDVDTDSGALKRRIVEELIRNYSGSAHEGDE